VMTEARPYAEPAAQKRSLRRERRTVLGVTAVLLVMVAFVVPHTADTPGDVPTALDGQLDRLPPGTPVFNSYQLGGWIAWRHPDLEQYIDGLVRPYSPEHVNGFYRTLMLEPGWYDVVRRSGAPVVLMESNSPLASALQQRGWVSSGSDAGYVLLHRPS